MELKSLPELQFADKSTANIEKSVIGLYEAMAGRTLAKGDPVRLFLEAIAAVIVQQRILIDYAAKQNLLAYATGGNLDHIGVLVGAERLPETAAQTTLRFTLSEARAQDILIPAGIRATAGDDVFFAVASPVTIKAGQTQTEAGAVCTIRGAAGNEYAPGEINQIVDPLPWVQGVANITASAGGSDAETDDAFRARIQAAPESFSCAGPDGAYEYFAKSASALIADVSVDSSEPGKVEIRPLLAGGELPGKEILDVVESALNARKVRPLTDHLFVLAPNPADYDVAATYWIAKDDATNAVAIQAAVQTAARAYVAWQKAKLGRDINPTELIYRLRAAGAKRVELTQPVFKTLSKAQVAREREINLLFGGLEDG